MRLAPLIASAVMLMSGCGDTTPETAPVLANEAAVAGNSAEARVPEPLPDLVQVRLETAAGPILLELDAGRAPITTANFVRYAEEGRFDGASFYRAAPTKNADGEIILGRGFIQGGIRRNYRKMLPPIAHEPTSETGLRHEAGTISMARAETGVGAMGEFFILASPMPSMDAGGDRPGYAAFGRVVEGMDVVRTILAAPTMADAGRGAMRGQMIAEPVAIVSARRQD